MKNGSMLRLEKILKVYLINESKMKEKNVLQAVKEIKVNFKVIQQGIYFYMKDDTLKLYGFLISIEIPHYLDMVDVLFYFDNEYTLQNQFLYRSQNISDSSEIKRISNILANEYKYEIHQRTFIPSKD